MSAATCSIVFCPRTQALFDLVLYLVLFVPGIFALLRRLDLTPTSPWPSPNGTFSPTHCPVAVQVRHPGRRLGLLLQGLA